MFVEGFGGGLPAEGFAGSTVQSRGDSVQVVPGVSAEVGAFGEVLTEETVGVLVGPTLPWCLGVAEVDIQIGIYAELSVLGHLGSLAPGQRTAQLLRQGGDRRRDGVAYGLGAIPTGAASTNSTTHVLPTGVGYKLGDGRFGLAGIGIKVEARSIG